MNRTLKQLFYQPKPSLDVAYMRILICGYFLYKLLSRDYSVFGLAPPAIMHIYPHQLFHWQVGYAFMGFPALVDLATFHWLHWFLPFPNAQGLGMIQAVAMLLCVAVILFGKGFRNVLVIGLFALLAYLWGYNWRTGGEVDAVFLQMQMLLAYCFFREPEALTLFGKKELPLRFTPQNGWFYSMGLAITCTYYFYSGFHKLVDINVVEWFDFNLTDYIGDLETKYALGAAINPLSLFYFLKNWPITNYIAVPLAYLAELFIPLMFFRRRWISFFMLFFIVFHLLTWAVGILFMGNIIIWFAFVPVHRLFQKVSLVWDDECRFCKRWVDRISRFDWLNRITWIGANQVPQASPDLVQGWNPAIVEESIWVKGIGSPEGYSGFFAFRRLAWAIPVAWPMLPLLYLPLVPNVGQRIYAWVARNRHQFGCRIT